MRALLAVELAKAPPVYELRASNATDRMVELTGYLYAKTAPVVLVSRGLRSLEALDTTLS